MDTTRYFGEDFNEFLQTLIKDRFNESKEIGIASRVIDKGFESLTKRQRFVFEKSINPLVYDKCKVCRHEISWFEMSAAEDNDGLCSECQQNDRHNN